MEQITMYEEGNGLEELAAIKSNDWKWEFKDYPKKMD